MKDSYDREEDILMLEIDDTSLFDHAEHSGSLFVHFGPDDRPVLIEIQNATALLTSSLAASMSAEPVVVS